MLEYTQRLVSIPRLLDHTGIMKCTQPNQYKYLITAFCIFIYMILSINIQPTKGGVAPLYKAFGPSCRIVLRKQSNGPLNLPSAFVVVCIRIFTVSIQLLIETNEQLKLSYRKGDLQPTWLCPKPYQQQTHALCSETNCLSIPGWRLGLLSELNKKFYKIWGVYLWT